MTGCLKIDAVCRTGSVVFKSGLALGTERRRNVIEHTEAVLVPSEAAFDRTHPDVMVGVVERLVAVTLNFEERASSHRRVAQGRIRVQVAARTSAYVGFAENALYR